MTSFQKIQIIDSHTGGEPTRVVVGGGPDLGRGSLAERREIFRREHDGFRSAVINEPRGSDVIVGAMLTPPADPSCVAGVVFFNNAGVLNMCGHGTIGVGVTLGHMGKIKAGRHKLETPVGIVTIEYDGANQVTFDNVPAYRHAKDVSLDVPGVGEVKGDIAWGGNWFFLMSEHGQELELANVDRLTDYTWKVRTELERRNITGANGGHIDHLELFGPPRNASAHSRNFVLCPGKAYDRSPCGTGTSAKLACLYADGKIREGDVWRQESIIGSLFEGRVKRLGEHIIPSITGTAYICAEATLLLDANDPFRLGIRA